MTTVSQISTADEPAKAGSILPGLALTCAIALAAFGLHQLPGLGFLSPLILAIVLGMALHNTIGTPAAALSGVKFGLRRVLRAGIVLLGLQLTLSQVGEVGWSGAAVIVVTLVSTFGFTKWLGRIIGVDHKLAELIAAGTSICGASAVIATNTVTRARDEDVAYAVACVTVFGSLSMVLLPLAGDAFGLTPQAYGLWTGASIHEVAQVVAAAFQGGEAAGHIGTIAKLTRVLMLAPMVLALGYAATRRRKPDQAGGGSVPVPWFVFGFMAMVGVASTGMVPDAAMPGVVFTTQFLLAVALASMGLETDLRKLAAKGLRPALLGAAAWLFILVLALALILLTGAAG
ncbi:YeiH family protein [Jiella sonneratiae]|uniref:YeiH family putative sulfate export transporter n=1 Tax=Jiella sonneratiae TaxID=2816856 RepID=A0ABS3J8A3_9HYPH|nr:YeiH family protein [Jiella sonneratiae]MBO0905332.1 YeiH family putative sulfate export transporter [Jiella sonneratiae]